MIYHGTPTLETERLVLRKFTPEDSGDMFEYASDAEVSKYVTWDTHKTIDDSLGFIKYTLNRYMKDETGEWGIVLKENNKFIGSCSFVWMESKNLCGNIGYVLSRQYWNKGIMTEAVKRLIRFSFEEMKLNRIEAVHFIENESSGRVMQKAGMKYEGLMRQKYFIKEKFRDIKQYAILKEDWEKISKNEK
ncbi:MAG: GNAT family protein [Clostridia bacterium]|jgi:ribosomal-protein-alanine N-acetyltransferase